MVLFSFLLMLYTVLRKSYLDPEKQKNTDYQLCVKFSSFILQKTVKITIIFVKVGIQCFKIIEPHKAFMPKILANAVPLKKKCLHYFQKVASSFNVLYCKQMT